MKLEFQKKTVADLLKERPECRRVLVQFYHGLGDAIMFFANCLPALEHEFPNVKFYVETQLGQDEIFGKVDPDEDAYDLAVFIGFPCSEWDEGTDETKAEKCGRLELGVEIPPDCPDYYYFFICPGKKHFASPLVGVHFQSTSCDEICCPEELAKLIWDRIQARGLIPIDTHFDHHGATIHRQIFPWETRNVTDAPASVGKLFGLIDHISGFAGVASGNFWAALCCLPPQKILFIETLFPARKLTHVNVHMVSVKDDRETQIKKIDAWLDWLDVFHE